MLSCYLYVTTFLADRLRRDDRGATLVEYGLLLALIAVICIPALVILGPKIAGLFTTVSDNL